MFRYIVNTLCGRSKQTDTRIEDRAARDLISRLVPEPARGIRCIGGNSSESSSASANSAINFMERALEYVESHRVASCVRHQIYAGPHDDHHYFDIKADWHVGHDEGPVDTYATIDFVVRKHDVDEGHKELNYRRPLR